MFTRALGSCSVQFCSVINSAPLPALSPKLAPPTTDTPTSIAAGGSYLFFMFFYLYIYIFFFIRVYEKCGTVLESTMQTGPPPSSKNGQLFCCSINVQCSEMYAKNIFLNFSVQQNFHFMFLGIWLRNNNQLQGSHDTWKAVVSCICFWYFMKIYGNWKVLEIFSTWFNFYISIKHLAFKDNSI